jgi:hypothetical protein
VSPEVCRPQISIDHEDALFSLLRSSRGHHFQFTLSDDRVVNGAVLGVQEVQTGTVREKLVVVMGRATEVVMVPIAKVQGIVAENADIQANFREAVVALIAERQSGIPLTLILPQGCRDTVTFKYATVTKTPWVSSYRIALHRGAGRNRGVEIAALAEVLNDSQLDWRNLQLTFITGAPELLGKGDGDSDSDSGDPFGSRKRGAGFTLALKMPSGSITRVQVLPTDTVESLAAKLRTSHSISGAKFIMNGKQMEGGRTLSDYGVGPQTTLTVLATTDVGAAGAPTAQQSFLLSDEASLTYHKAPSPISCGRSASLVVPYLTSAVIPAELVHLYDPAKRSGNPALSLLFVNTFSRLEGGKVLVQDAVEGKMLGEAKISAVPLGDDVLLPYAVDLSVEISFESVVSTSAVIEVRCDKGQGSIVTKRPQLNTTTYTVENRSEAEINLIVKHRFLEGWALVKESSTLEPVDIADGHYTLTTLVPPQGKRSSQAKPYLISVVEKTFVEESRDVQGLTAEDIERLSTSKFVTPAVESQLKAILQLRENEESLARKIHRAQTEAGEIRQSQDRTKETLTVLGDTPDAKRFLKQLSNEQDKIDELMATVKTQQVQKQKTRQEIAQAVEKLAFKINL